LAANLAGSTAGFYIRAGRLKSRIEQDTPVKSIMKTTGHADERTFRRYNQRLREDQHRDVTRILDDAET
jgi:hypothetical protein